MQQNINTFDLHNPTSEKKLPAKIFIEVDSVSKIYNKHRKKIYALSNINLTIHTGEFVAIIGSSGSGKSTLLQIIGALDKASSGKVIVNGQNLTRMSDGKLSNLRNQTIGFIFQFFYLQPYLKLRKNIEVAAMPKKCNKFDRHEAVTKLAEMVGLSDRLEHYPRELSGGQIQRAAIARALLNSPELIIADEPTGNLDEENSKSIIDLLKSLQETHNTTIVIATHDPLIAAQADRVVTLRDGLIV